MELIYTDADRDDIGFLQIDSGDFAWGVEENDFELTLEEGQEVPAVGAAIYIDGTDIFGIVRGSSRESGSKTKIVGDTWTGLLDCRVMRPPSGSVYFKVSGDMRDCVSKLISQSAVTDLFTVPSGKVGLNVSHTFQGRNDDSTQSDTGRYMGAWAALWQLLSEHSCKVVARYDAESRKIALTPQRRDDYTDTENMEHVGTTVAISTRRPVNHLVCLGQGTGTARTVLDLYMDAKGNVSTTQTLKLADEIAEVYDDSNAEDAAALQSDGTARLKEYWDASQSVSMDADADMYDLGDLVGGTDPTTGINATAIVTKKVLTFSDGIATVSYETTVR